MENVLCRAVNPIVCGDWNINNSSKEKVFVDLLNVFGLSDVAKVLNKQHIATRCDKRSANRLDRVVMTNMLSRDCDLRYDVMICTDHHMLTCIINTNIDKFKKKKRLKPLLEDLLSDNKRDEWFNIVDDIINRNEDLTPSSLWLLLKKVAYDFFVSSELRNKRNIENDICELNTKLRDMINSGKLDEIEFFVLKEKLEKLHTVKLRCLLTKYKGSFKKFKNKNNDVLLKALKKKD